MKAGMLVGIFGGLNINLFSYKSESQKSKMGLSRLKRRLYFFLDDLGENPFSCLQEAARILDSRPFSNVKASKGLSHIITL